VNNQAGPEPGRLQLLAQLITPEALAIIKERLTPEQIALLVIEAINPHKALTIGEQAKRDGVHRTTITSGKR
jgi:hypothetical protein